MLAKELKIKNLKTQIAYFRARLTLPNETGDISFKYIGFIYPETIEYFAKEGVSIKKVDSKDISVITEGLNMYVFTIEDIKLNQEELNQAFEYNTESHFNGDIREDPVMQAVLRGECRE